MQAHAPTFEKGCVNLIKGFYKGECESWENSWFWGQNLGV